MALVVFLRAVNIAGHQTFKPSALAKDLSHLDVVNIGTAGTFVVFAKISPTRLRQAILAELDFVPDMMICPSKEVDALTKVARFEPVTAGMQSYVTVMASPLTTKHRFPISVPESGEWQLRLAAASGRFVISHRRLVGQAKYYPNEIVEKRFGVPATTRNWTTITKIHDILASRV